MIQEQWSAVDRYIEEILAPSDPVLDAALKASTEAGLPAIQVAPVQGKLLQILAQAVGARRILEIGTLGGYSTIWLARALPARGRLVTLEVNARHAEVARSNIARAGLADVVELRLGLGLETLSQLVAEKQAPFDFVFIDADKPGYAEYFAWVLKLTRPGSLIIADNVVRKGAVADPGSDDANVQGIRKFNEAVRKASGVTATAIQTVGSKGYDGFAIVLVVADE